MPTRRVQTVAFNGIHGGTGRRLHPLETVQDLAESTLAALAPLVESATSGVWQLPHLVQKAGIDFNRKKRRGGAKALAPPDPCDLSSVGWGVIAAEDEDPAVLEALAPLLLLRRSQAARCREDLYHEFIAEKGYEPGQSKSDFLRDRGLAPGAFDPTLVPYYVLMVGSPEKIPFSFQHDFDFRFAVGRIAFDTIEEYARYAESVVEAEERGTRRDCDLAVFSVRHEADETSQLMCDYLAQPVAEMLAAEGHGVETFLAGEANKRQLLRLLGGRKTPSLLFTATHGVGFDCGDPLQETNQGALLCEDWPSAGNGHCRLEDCYVAAGDIPDTADLRGLIAFHYACHSAGTPALEDFAGQGRIEKRQLAQRPFVAKLPQRMLAHPRGGALAVIGHVERSWGYSFLWRGVGPQSQAFVKSLHGLLEGQPVGYAMEPFGQRALDLTQELQSALRDLGELAEGSGAADQEDLDELRAEVAGLWTASQDAKNYIILGDPAVRLPPREHWTDLLKFPRGTKPSGEKRYL